MDKEELRQVIAEELDKRLPLMRKYLTTEEKAHQLGITPDTLRRKARNGEIPCEKTGDGKKARYRFKI